MRLRPLGLWLLVAISAAPLSPARAQMESREGIALQNQILELRRDLQGLQSQVGRGSPPAPAVPPGATNLGLPYPGRSAYPAAPPGGGNSDLVTQLLDRVQAVEEQVRQLRGQLDEVTNQTQRQNAEMAKQLGDLSFQLQQGGTRPPAGGPTSAPAAPPSTSPLPTTLAPSPSRGAAAVSAAQPAATTAPAPARRTPEMALQEGHAALARRDYPIAEAAAREVLQGSRTSPRAYDAQFLLAQALAGERNYAQSAIAFDDAYNRSRTGSHAADSLVGLANSLTAIGEKRAACETINKLNAEFPNQRSDIREEAAGVRQRAGCR